MKILKYITLIFVSALSIVACEEDSDLTTINENDVVAPVLTGIDAEDAFTLLKANREDTLVTISWTDVDYGEPLATTYTIQIDKVGSNFANPIEFITSSNTTFAVVIDEINTRMFNMDGYYPPLVEANVEIRIKAVVSELLGAVYSSVTQFYITPFDAGKPKLYVTGTHQPTAWDFASAQTVYSLNEDEEYVGYIYFTSCEFKFNKTPSVAWGAGSSAGSIAIDGGNLTNATESMYWVTVDTLAATYTTEVRNWGVIGSATPTSWDSDTDMEYDFALGKLKVTMDLTAAEIKFRVNDDWGINLGDTGADGTMEAGGDNIAVPEAGNYTIYLDLSNPERFSYELVKN